MQTIAEFVETEEALRQLHHIGVDFVQGFGLQVPQPLEAAEYHVATP
jgi:EAL domain-containing protein (putative c-di-GMP-specific phosphodiesterase class I)